jgi:hypothetical protein
MSFSLEVFAVSGPDDLAARWLAALAQHGLVVDPPPGFRPSSWRGGWLPFTLRVTDAGPGAVARYPRHAVRAGFELDVAPYDGASDLAADAPEDVRGILGSATRVFSLTSPAGRTVADLRLQCWAAATLAAVTGGAVYDPQQGAFFTGAGAAANALREVEEYEGQAADDAWKLETAAES